MAIFTLKSVGQILFSEVSSVSANSAITDINAGSVVLTLLEADATEVANAYIQMLNIINSNNIDILTGAALDNKAYEYGLVRLASRPASGFCTFSDSNVTKVQTNIYSGLPGPSAGSVTINVVINTDLPLTASGIIVGRGTNNVEAANYNTITNMGTYYVLNLAAPLTKDHGTDETVILSQGGLRVVPAGTGVYVPESDLTDQIDFVLQSDATLLDGEEEVLNCTVICTQNGTIGNVNVGAIQYYSSILFPTAVVHNPGAFSNGRDTETDEELRERIRAYIQSLSRGTITSLLFAASQISSAEQNNKVVSTNFIEATTLNELNFLYIDDGIGLEPWFESEVSQTVIEVAAGGEKFLQLDNDKTPLAKASLVTINSQPFGITPGQTLILDVNGISETITFGGIDMFAVPGAATAEEVEAAINDNSTLVEARTSENRTKVVIEARANDNEKIKVVGGTANVALGFKSGAYIQTLNLYKNDVLLNKDGVNAYVESAIEPSGGFILVNPSTLQVVVDGISTVVQTITFTVETTVADIINRINLELAGAVATTVSTSTGDLIRLTSTNPTAGNSAIQIISPGGAGDANVVLQFPTALSSGVAKDYSLNKYNGQIELESVLSAGDEIVAGSANTRAYLESTLAETSLVAQPYIINIGEQLIVQVDDIIDSTVTTQVDASNFIDASLIGVYADNHFVNTYVRFKNTTTTAALQGVSRLVSAFDSTTGQFTTAAFPAIPTNVDVYEIVQIGTATANLTLSADDVQTYINQICPEIRGISFYGKQKNLNRYVRIQTNSFNLTGKIRVHAATTMTGLALPTSITATAQESNIGYIESNNEENQYADGFVFGPDQNAIFIVDNDVTYKTVTVDMGYSAAVTSAVNNHSWLDTSLIPAFSTDILTGCKIRFEATTTTAALRNVSRTVVSYNPTTGAIDVGVGTPFPAAPVIGDIYEIYPQSAKNVVDLFNNRSYTNLATIADIQSSSNGARVQIASKIQGSAGGVQCAGGLANTFSIPLLAPGGTAGGTFQLNSVGGLSRQLPVVINDNGTVGPTNITITSITGATAPYAMGATVDSGGTDLSMYLEANGAYIMPRNSFEFTTVPNTGIDGYKYYTGLIQEVQWQIDGKDTDPANYPGVKAAGVMIEVKAPVIRYVSITLDATVSQGMTLSQVVNDIKSVVSNYINNLGVGQDVIMSEIIAAVMGVNGVVDVTIIAPTLNIPISANELPRIDENDIMVG